MLNVVYSYVVERIPTEDEDGNKRDYRQEFDDMLGVHKWPVPRTNFGSQRYVERVRSTAPSWWHGDEEASQSFLMAMNVGGGSNR